MSFFGGIINAIKKFFSGGFKNLDKVVLAVTEGVKKALNDGIFNFVAQILDTLTKSNVPTEIVDILNKNIYKVLAVELAVQGLPSQPTPDEILEFEKAVLKAFNVTSDKSKLYTTLAAQLYGLIQDQLKPGHGLTFAQIVAIVEQTYLDYLADQQETSA